MKPSACQAQSGPHKSRTLAILICSRRDRAGLHFVTSLCWATIEGVRPQQKPSD